MKKTNHIKKNLYILSLILIAIIAPFTFNYIKEFNKESNIKKSNYNVYLESIAGSGTYSKTNTTLFPTSGYTFNAEKSTCQNGTALTYNSDTKTLSLTTDKSDKCDVYFDIELLPSKKTLQNLGLTTANVNTTTPNFANTATTAEGIFSAPDDYGTSYYYRGAVTNNYVQFAGFYWRIIRINGDGSLRMIYDGTSAHANGEISTDRQIGTSKFNTSYDDNAYVGYMYGKTGASTYAATHANTNSSTIKTYIDNWYKTNIVDTGNSSSIADVIYCNDRELDSGTGAGTTVTYYKAYNRLVTNKTPKLSCTQKNDAFTVADEEKGNGALTYPVGLITADELSYAGKVSGTFNTSDYLYIGNWFWGWFWGLSPYGMYSGGAYVFNVGDNMSYNYLDRTYGVRPVISLSAEYCENLVGDGTSTNPYHT